MRVSPAALSAPTCRRGLQPALSQLQADPGAAVLRERDFPPVETFEDKGRSFRNLASRGPKTILTLPHGSVEIGAFPPAGCTARRFQKVAHHLGELIGISSYSADPRVKVGFHRYPLGLKAGKKGIEFPGDQLIGWEISLL